MDDSAPLMHEQWLRLFERWRQELQKPITINAEQISGGGQPLTRTNDTNVTLTLGGTPLTALLKSVSLTVGWAGTLAVSRGGIGVGTLASNGVLYGNGTSAVLALAVNAGTKQFLSQTSSAAPAWSSVAASDVTAGAALTRVNDTNVTVTLGGSPTTALLAATSLTLGWTGTLALTRGGLGFDASGIAKGGIFSGTGAAAAGIVVVGANGTVLTADSTVAGGVKWVAGGTGTVTGSGTTGTLSKWSAATALTDSLIVETTNALTVTGSAATPGQSVPLLKLIGNFAGATGSHVGLFNITATLNASASSKASSAAFFDATITGSGTGYGAGLRVSAQDNTALGNQLFGVDVFVQTTAANANKDVRGFVANVGTVSTTADTVYGASLFVDPTGVITSGTRTTYGVNATTNTSGNNGGTDNVYAGYFVAGGVVTSGTINTYGVYVGNNTAASTAGTSKNIGLYVEAITGADTNYAAIFAGGNVGIGTTTPTEALDISAAGSLTLKIESSIATSSFARIYLLGRNSSNAVSDWRIVADNTAGETDGGFVVYGGNGTSLDYRLLIAPAGAISFYGKAAKYNSIATAGWGVPAIYGVNRQAALTASLGATTIYTVGAADGSFIVSINLLINSGTAFNLTPTIGYTDEGGTARTYNVPMKAMTGTINTAGSITATGPEIGLTGHFRCKASTTITYAVLFSGTSVNYNAEAIVQQVA